MKTQRVSLVIATYRRETMLRDAVNSLLSMDIPPEVAVEILIIDNDPSGGARATAFDLQALAASPFELRYVHETQTGLSHARNRGILESTGGIVGFLDDDVFVSKGWLTSVLGCFARTGADCVGGRTLVHWESEPHPVLRACATQLLAVDLGPRDCEVRGQYLPGGGNAAFRRSVFDQGYRFPIDLGRVGRVLLSGEDSDLMLRLRRAGGRIWYCADASVQHRTGGERLTLDYIARQKYWVGVSSAVIDRKIRGRAKQACLAFARMFKLVLISLPRLGLATLRADRAGALLARCSAATQLGYLRATLSTPHVTVGIPTATATKAAVAT